jgi:hypothetical protein
MKCKGLGPRWSGVPGWTFVKEKPGDPWKRWPANEAVGCEAMGIPTGTRVDQIGW